MRPSSSDFTTPPEPFTSFDESVCDPSPQPGVVRFKDWVMSEWGGRSLGIVRECGLTGSTSGHYSGSAWDWGLNASDPQEAAIAEDMLQWLLKNDAEMFRRAGLGYVIWNKKIYSPRISTSWRPYTGRSPHTDHVHFSFGPDGAAGSTSFFGWLDGPKKKSPVLAPKTVVPAVAGGVLGFFVVTYLQKRRKGR